jgi:hypothetical protein
MMIIWKIRVAARQDSKKSAKTKNWLATMLAGLTNVSTYYEKRTNLEMIDKYM